MSIVRKGIELVRLPSQIEMIGRECVSVDGCKKILEYNDIVVRLKTWDLRITVWGSGLTVSDFGTGSVSIKGRISSVELE